MADFNEQTIAELFKRRHARAGDEFLRVLRRDGRIVAPGIYDAYGAFAARQNHLERQTFGIPCEYNAVYLGGWSVSAMLWRRPDMGFHDRTMMSLIGRYSIPMAYPLTVIMDAETGFGPEPVNIADTVKDYDQIGVALGHLEDQGTRRCGNLGGKACITPEEMSAKILMWLTASEEIGSSMHLMARTDAFTAAGGGLTDAIERMKRYMDTEYKGRRPLVSWADALMCIKDLRAWVGGLLAHNPKMVMGINYSPNKPWTKHYSTCPDCKEAFGGKPPTYNDLVAMGFRVIWHTILQARADQESGWNIMDRMADEGAKALWDMHDRHQGKPYGDPQAMSGAREYQALDKFIGGNAAESRYDRSSGYGTDDKK